MKTSWNRIVCIACLGLAFGWATTASAGPLRGMAKAAVRGATGGSGSGMVRSLAAAGAKMAVQQAIPGGNDIKKQLLGAAVEMGVRGGLEAASQLRQGGGFGGGQSFGQNSGGGFISNVACPSTYSVPRNYIPAGNHEYIISETVIETSEPVEYAVEQAKAEVVEPAAPAPQVAIDLKLVGVKLVDRGNQQQGPSYRVTVQNVGRTDVTTEITVALLASMEADSNENVSALGSVAALKSGETKSVDLRLPPGSQALPHLTAVVAPTDAVDFDETDNIANLQQ